MTPVIKVSAPALLCPQSRHSLGPWRNDRARPRRQESFMTPRRQSFEMLPADVTSDASVAGGVMRVEGGSDLLVNNAGFSVASAGAEKSSIRTSPVDFRYELRRDGPDDPRRRAPHATSREGSRHQHQLHIWFSVDALPVCGAKTPPHHGTYESVYGGSVNCAVCWERGKEGRARQMRCLTMR